MPFLTGDSIAGSETYQVTIPADVFARRAVAGAICALGEVYNWEQYGTGTPDEYALAFQDACNSFGPLTAGSTVEKLVDVYMSFQLSYSVNIWRKWDAIDTERMTSPLWSMSTHRFTPDQDGYYLIEWLFTRVAAKTEVHTDLRVNGVTGLNIITSYNAAPQHHYRANTILPMSASDYLEFWLFLTGDTFILSNAEPRSGVRIWRLGDL